MATYYGVPTYPYYSGVTTSATMDYEEFDNSIYRPFRIETSATATTYSIPSNWVNATSTNYIIDNGANYRWSIPSVGINYSETDVWLNNVEWPYVEVPFQESKEDIFKQKLKTNLCIFVKSRAELPFGTNPAERIAMETLREHVSESEFRKYIKYGFVLVKGQSGDVFQIFRNRSHTKVWRDGKVVEEICVRIQDSKVPPTDNVIAFRQIIQTSESEFRKLGNVYKMGRAA